MQASDAALQWPALRSSKVFLALLNFSKTFGKHHSPVRWAKLTPDF